MSKPRKHTAITFKRALVPPDGSKFGTIARAGHLTAEQAKATVESMGGCGPVTVRHYNAHQGGDPVLVAEFTC